MSVFPQLQYSTSFNVKQYLEMYYRYVEQDYLNNFRVKIFKEFFQKYSAKWDGKSARLLEFGGGAIILSYISAAPYVAEIVHSAYTEDEQREIIKWKNDTEGAHDWTPAIKYAVAEIEGLKGDKAQQERVALLRSKIKVTSCNIFDDHPVDPTEGQEKFSIISTSFVLEAACENYDDFKVGLKKLVKMLRLGGYIAILFLEEETYFVNGQGKWPVLPVSMAQVKEAVEEAGCVVLMSERDPTPINILENPTDTDEKACVFLAAYKVTE